MHSGNARSLAMESIQKAKAGKFEAAEAKIREAEEEFVLAHRHQTELIQGRLPGLNSICPSFLSMPRII